MIGIKREKTDNERFPWVFIQYEIDTQHHEYIKVRIEYPERFIYIWGDARQAIIHYCGKYKISGNVIKIYKGEGDTLPSSIIRFDMYEQYLGDNIA